MKRPPKNLKADIGTTVNGTMPLIENADIDNGHIFLDSTIIQKS